VIEIFGFLQELSESVEVFKKDIEIRYDWVPVVVFTLFTFMNSIRIFAYVPQLLKVTEDKNGASAISYSTWTLFFLSHLTTVAFAIFYVGDLVMALIFSGNALACFAILLATFVKRRRHAAGLRSPQ
jgi:uncharacterized protein with PQ loop repeat